MNEGAATYVHYRIMNSLYERGAISEGNFLEFLQSHTNVVFQPGYDDARFSGFNPYALGFAMMQDLERIVSDPETEDRDWFPDIAGNKNVMSVLRDIWANYRDESFISQFLSPRVMRQMRMFQLRDDPSQTEGVKVAAIHNERGYRRIRRELARQYDVGWAGLNIEVVDVDLAGDRRLILRHAVVNGCLLEEANAKRVLQHLADLWSYDVLLRELDPSDSVIKEHMATQLRGLSRPEDVNLSRQAAPGHDLGRWAIVAALAPPEVCQELEFDRADMSRIMNLIAGGGAATADAPEDVRGGSDGTYKSARCPPRTRKMMLRPLPRGHVTALQPCSRRAVGVSVCSVVRSRKGIGEKWSRPLGAWGRGWPGPRRSYVHTQYITPFASKQHVDVHYPHNPQLQPHSRLNRPAAAGSFERFSGALGAETWGACRDPRGPAFTPHCAQANRGPWDHYRRKLWRSAQQAQKTTC